MNRMGPLPNATPKLLIFEEDGVARRLLSETLTSFFQVHTAQVQDVESAFDHILHRPYDFIIMRLDLPIMPGALLFQLLSKISNHQHSSHTGPAVLFTIDAQNINHIPATLKNDVRVKAIVPRPIRIAPLIEQLRKCFQDRFPACILPDLIPSLPFPPSS